MMNLLNQTTESEQISPQETMRRMIMGLGVAQSIYVAAKLGIADLVKDGPKACDELAIATNTHNDSLYRLLRALASVGVFVETEAKYFQLTPLAACLLEDEPGSLRNFILLQGEQEYTSWGNMLYSVRTGKSAFEHVHGMPVFEYLRQNPVEGMVFRRAMANVSAIHKAGITSAYDFSVIKKLVDVGGGQGGLLAAILQHYSNLRGVLFDQPQTIEQAHSLLEKEGVLDRCELVAGNFFNSVPTGADAYLLKNIFHDWDDQKAIRILQNCRQAMTEGGRVLVIEKVISSKNVPWRSLFGDIKMLVMLGGLGRTKNEFRDLFEAAGFKLTKLISIQPPISLIEGIAEY